MFDLRSIFDEANERMSSRFNLIREVMTHPGEKGGAVEDAVKGFWREFLPKRIGITSGFVFDTKGNVSKQLDLIFYDELHSPQIFKGNSFQFLPIECTFAAAEIKTDLNSKSLLIDCLQKAKSYKNLERLAYHVNTGQIINYHSMYGKEFDRWQSIFFVFSLTGSNIRDIYKWYNEINTENLDPNGTVIDSACVVDRGIIAHARIDQEKSSRELDFIHGDGYKTAVITCKNTLIFYYMLASRYILQASIGNFRPAAYLRDMALEVE